MLRGRFRNCLPVSKSWLSLWDEGGEQLRIFISFFNIIKFWEQFITCCSPRKTAEFSSPDWGSETLSKLFEFRVLGKQEKSTCEISHHLLPILLSLEGIRASEKAEGKLLSSALKQASWVGPWTLVPIPVVLHGLPDFYFLNFCLHLSSLSLVLPEAKSLQLLSTST